MSLEKKYVIVGARLESKDIVSLEILDESSQSPLVKTAVFRLGTDDYEKLGSPTVRTKLSVVVDVTKD